MHVSGYMAPRMPHSRHTRVPSQPMSATPCQLGLLLCRCAASPSTMLCRVIQAYGNCVTSLQAYGNSVMPRNDDSSRFGKLYKLHFHPETCTITGAEVEARPPMECGGHPALGWVGPCSRCAMRGPPCCMCTCDGSHIAGVPAGEVSDHLTDGGGAQLPRLLPHVCSAVPGGTAPVGPVPESPCPVQMNCTLQFICNLHPAAGPH